MSQLNLEEQRAWWGTLDARVSSAALIIEDSQGRALMVKANYKPYWTFPGGLVDAGETPLQAAVREAREEVGLVIDPARAVFQWVANRSSAAAESYQFVFKVVLEPTALPPVRLQAEEIDDYAWVTADEVRAAGRQYGTVIQHWAHGVVGYVEQASPNVGLFGRS